MNNETWRYVPFNDKYQVSLDGHIRNSKTNKTLRPSIHPKGYLTVTLFTDGKSKRHLVHRIVAITFIDNPENFLQVNHIDGDKTNNNANNLEWATNSRNQIHRIQILGSSPSKPEKEVEMRDKIDSHLINTYRSVKEASRQTGVFYGSIYNNCNNISKSAGGFIWNYNNKNI